MSLLTLTPAVHVIDTGRQHVKTPAQVASNQRSLKKTSDFFAAHTKWLHHKHIASTSAETRTGFMASVGKRKALEGMRWIRP